MSLSLLHSDLLVHVDSTHKHHKDMYKTLELLKYEDVICGEVFFVVEGCAEFESLEEVEKHHQYFYEEHTCPLNFIKGVEIIVNKGDADPHGLFTHVATVWMTEEYLELKEKHQHEKYLTRIFPQMGVNT